MRSKALLIPVLVLVTAVLFSAGQLYSSADERPPAIIYTSALKFDALAWLHGGERFPQGAKLWMSDGKQSRQLAPDFAMSADANVSFDGKRVLFAGKRGKQPWQIWELALTDGKATQITKCDQDCIRPFYLPEDRLVYSRKRDKRFVLEAAGLDGTKPQQLTFAPGNFLADDVLLDGRVLFTSLYPMGSGTKPELYTVYSDGSGVESYRCDHGEARYAGRQVASGDIIFTHGTALGRFTSPLAHEVAVEMPAGEYAGNVIEAPGGSWLLSARPQAKASFALQWWKPSEKSLTPAVADAAGNAIEPVLVISRRVPNRHPSGLHDWKTANLLTLNSYLSRTPSQIDPIATVRGYTVDATGHSKPVGTSPVEKDGSFFVQVMGDQPVRFELVDASGKVLRSEQAWFWARKGEQRICVGCHTGPERAPDNEIPQTLLRTTEPADLTGAATKPSAGGKK